ncbi:MAG: hypothetical protein ABSC92_00455 [Rhizomicrobium sp.]|jgi:hypothetical protein
MRAHEKIFLYIGGIVGLLGLYALVLMNASGTDSESAASAAPIAQTGGYTISGDAWTCTGRGAIAYMEATQGDAAASRAEHAECLPMLSAGPVNVIAFQGKYAFICDRLKDDLGESFACTYALTKDLRDSKGARVPDHFSKQSPSPRFFDGS